jgi:hypothetical protein
MIGSVQVGAIGSFKRVNCYLADVRTDLILDFGAEVSILARSLYECSPLVSFPLRPADVTLRAYNGQPIECLGRITIPVTVGQVKLPQFTFYVTSKSDSMMGVDLFDALGGKVQLGRTRIVNEPATGVASISPDLSPSSQSSVKLSQFPAFTAGSVGYVASSVADPAVPNGGGGGAKIPSPLLPLLPSLPPLPLPSPPVSSLPLPSLPSPSPRSGAPEIQLGGLGERCKLPQWGPGRSPGRQRFWCVLKV